MSDDFNSNYPFPSGAAPDNEPESLPPIRLKIPDYEEEEEEESEEEEVNYRSQRVAVAAFNTRSEDYERRSQLAAEALSEEKARRRAESFSGTKRILLSFAVGIGVILALWLFIQSRTHQKNDADTHKVSFYYAVTEENTIKITAADSLNVNLIEVPDRMNGKEVTCISANAFAGHIDMETIVLPGTITEIGYNAFYDCELLDNVEIPDSVTTLSYCAFKGCKSLKNIRLPANITEIEYGMFGECFKLDQVDIPQGVTSIGHGAFQRCTGLKEIALPDGLTKIEYDAFRDCIALETIALPDSVQEIGSSVFSGCTSLRSVTVPKSTSKLILYAFANCTSLEEIHIHEDVTAISDNAFNNCPKLTIYGKPGSYAEKYAQQYGIPFAEEVSQEDSSAATDQ